MKAKHVLEVILVTMVLIIASVGLARFEIHRELRSSPPHSPTQNPRSSVAEISQQLSDKIFPEGEIIARSKLTMTNSQDPFISSMVKKAKQDLAKRLSMQLHQIVLVEAKPVVWPDTSLGCPQPGMRYLHVLQDGLLIRLQVGTKIYYYHSGRNRPPFLCETPVEDGG